MNNEKEVRLLELLKSNPRAGQRDMAESIGLSVGMTNLLLKGLAAKGWMMMRRLTARNMQYVLTPEGLRELSRRSYRFLKKSIRGVAECRIRLETLVLSVQASNCEGLHLVGSSDLEFVLDYLCRQHGVRFRSSGDPLAGWHTVFGENEPEERPNILDFLEVGSMSSR